MVFNKCKLSHKPISHCHLFMKTALLGGLSLFAAVIFGCAALHVFNSCILPWSMAPGTTHITLVLPGVQVSGGWLYVPFVLCVLLAITMAYYSVMILKKR